MSLQSLLVTATVTCHEFALFSKPVTLGFSKFKAGRQKLHDPIYYQEHLSCRQIMNDVFLRLFVKFRESCVHIVHNFFFYITTAWVQNNTKTKSYQSVLC